MTELGTLTQKDVKPTHIVDSTSGDMAAELEPVKERNELTWVEITEYFREAGEDETLDIYQICAFLSYDPSASIRKRWYYYFKAFMCFVIQIAGLIIFIYIQVDNILGDKGLCAMSTADERNAQLTQVLAIFLAIYISLKMGGLIIDLGSKGLYTMDFYTANNCPPFINKYWVLFGGWINIGALLLSVYGSYIVLYISDDILDVILNSVALFFMLDVDDYILDSADYQYIEDWFEKKYNPQQYANYTVSAFGSCCGMLVKIMTTMAFAACGLGVFAAIFAPFWVAICH